MNDHNTTRTTTMKMSDSERKLFWKAFALKAGADAFLWIGVMMIVGALVMMAFGGCIAEVDAPEPDPVVAPAPAPVVVEPPDAGGPAFPSCGAAQQCNCGPLKWECCRADAGRACTCIGSGTFSDDVIAETAAQCAELRAQP